jgi:two-component system LytT family response regulator
MDRLSVLVVDDEGPARRRIGDLLRRQVGVGTVAEAANGVQAVEAIRERSPDVVFLDVQMPELDGFGVVSQIGAEQMPVTVFVTAYDAYAIRAFDAHALDYLLKPFSDERCEQALARAQELIAARRAKGQSRRLSELLARNGAEAPPSLDRLVVKQGGTLELLPTCRIDWLGAAGVYVEIHAGKKTYLHRGALADLERRLDPVAFTRIHRSTMVAIDRILRLEPQGHGEHLAVLQDGTQLRVSRTYRCNLEARLRQPLS